MEMLQIRMLGGFSAQVREKRIDDLENRSQKPWLLLAYLICNRERTVTQEELLRLCWEGEEKDDPANALRVVLHRTRALLDKLAIGSGMDLILRSRDGFCWSSHLPVSVDVEEFENLYAAGNRAKDEEKKLECFLRAIELYRGDFLGRNSGGTWGRYMADKQRERYIEMALAALDILSGSGREKEAVALARKVLGIEPYRESVCRRLMENLISLGRVQEAVQQYEQLRTSLLTAFDRIPEEETQRVYFRAMRKIRAPKISVDIQPSEWDENRGKNGARVCDFSFFRTFYVSVEYLIGQCGLEIYNLLFTLESAQEKEPSRRTVDRAMEMLLQQMKADLGRGTALTRCADNQLLAMINADGYEEACLCWEQQLKKFRQSYPGTAVQLSYGVWRVGEDMTDE